MPSERLQRQIDRLLDEAELAMAQGDWNVVRLRSAAALALDAEQSDARGYLAAAESQIARAGAAGVAQPPAAPAPALPEAFAGGRFRVLGLLGEGGKKIVYRVHDSQLDREVAFALLKTDGLDAVGRERVRREAHTLGRLSAHPN